MTSVHAVVRFLIGSVIVIFAAICGGFLIWAIVPEQGIFRGIAILAGMLLAGAGTAVILVRTRNMQPTPGWRLFGWCCMGAFFLLKGLVWFGRIWTSENPTLALIAAPVSVVAAGGCWFEGIVLYRRDRSQPRQAELGAPSTLGERDE